MVADHERYKDISNFRIDRMDSVVVSNSERNTEKVELPFNEVSYSKQLFKMYSGDALKVDLRFDNSLTNIVFDRFGKDVAIYKKTEDHFSVVVEVTVTKTFFSWIFMLGSGVQIIGPVSVVEEYHNLLTEINELYNNK
ncbi:putative DNA-binding transcriptional regulator YafY [Fusibacter tunisiensis]|uniref:DNA-binding transcriptional regulator YafY n=2 Tax=Fusibacter tunisiensis TaxID=1008308 RepID=A0ABS2MUG1_9FIRM|nr:putative DNA-binding transcriptional regulator YafY [Fusibacter tunisiensis]